MLNVQLSGNVQMRLTRQTNYAIRTLIYCASNGARLSRVGEIAAAYSASEMFLFKILQPLVEAGIVETVRGRNGGIRLARPADKISLREVVEVSEESFVLAECFEAGPVNCPLIESCALNEALRKALTAFLDALGEYTIADLVADKTFVRGQLGLSEAVDSL
jgi:Rrf2 family iron-responsive transcriptional regulator